MEMTTTERIHDFYQCITCELSRTPTWTIELLSKPVTVFNFPCHYFVAVESSFFSLETFVIKSIPPNQVTDSYRGKRRYFLDDLVIGRVLKHVIRKQSTRLCIETNNVGQPAFIVVVIENFFAIFFLYKWQFLYHVAFAIKSETNLRGVVGVHNPQHPDRLSVSIVKP